MRRPLLALLVACSAPASAATALRVAEGSVARSEVVALGRDLVVAGEVRSDAAVIDGDAEVRGAVDGDLIVLGGNVRLYDGATIGGDVFALGGSIDTEGTATIGGRSAAYPSIGAAWLTLLEGPSLGVSALSRIVLAAKLALLTAWLALTVLLMAVSGRAVLATSEGVFRDALRNFVTGLTCLVALFLGALLVVQLLPGVAGAPLVALIVLAATVLKLWGLVAVFHAVGRVLGAVALSRQLQPLNAATLGLLALGAAKLVPWVGTVVWWTATLIGIGVALTTKFGRRESWLTATAPAPSPIA